MLVLTLGSYLCNYNHLVYVVLLLKKTKDVNFIQFSWPRRLSSLAFPLFFQFTRFPLYQLPIDLIMTDWNLISRRTPTHDEVLIMKREKVRKEERWISSNKEGLAFRCAELKGIAYGVVHQSISPILSLFCQTFQMSILLSNQTRKPNVSISEFVN